VMAADPRTSGTIYLTVGTGLSKSTNFGTYWFVQGSSPPAQVTALAVSSFGTDNLYAGTSSGVYASTDGGATWVPMNAGLPSGRVMGLVVDPASPPRLFAAVEGRGVFASADSAANWTPVNEGLGNLNVLGLAINQAGTFLHAGTQAGVYDLELCVPSPAAACLSSSGRFRVEVNWRAPDGSTGAGQAVSAAADTGTFWFFTNNNVELVVKVVDGRPFNNKFWVFYGALSNVEYTIKVTDTWTGLSKTYFNPQGQLASVADTSAF
jgi:ligand-binding sensor domain-containing protein